MRIHATSATPACAPREACTPFTQLCAQDDPGPPLRDTDISSAQSSHISISSLSSSRLVLSKGPELGACTLCVYVDVGISPFSHSSIEFDVFLRRLVSKPFSWLGMAGIVALINVSVNVSRFISSDT